MVIGLFDLLNSVFVTAIFYGSLFIYILYRLLLFCLTDLLGPSKMAAFMLLLAGLRMTHLSRDMYT